MKVLKLSTTYFGNYAEVDEHVIMPIQANGSIFGHIPLNEIIERSVYLGELEGKHSYCEGDLIAKIVDLSTMNPRHVQYLVQHSDFSIFEVYFEQVEEEFNEYLEELKEEEDNEYNEIKEEEKLLYSSLGMEPLSDDYIGRKARLVYDVFIKKVEEYVAPRKIAELNVLESDLEKIKVLLLQNQIEFFE